MQRHDSSVHKAWVPADDHLYSLMTFRLWPDERTCGSNSPLWDVQFEEHGFHEPKLTAQQWRASVEADWPAVQAMNLTRQEATRLYQYYDIAYLPLLHMDDGHAEHIVEHELVCMLPYFAQHTAIANRAASRGKLGLLRHLTVDFEDAFYHAVAHDQISVIDWLHTRVDLAGAGARAWYLACRLGRLAALTRLHELGVEHPGQRRVHSHYQGSQWRRDVLAGANLQHPSDDPWFLCCAAQRGHVHIVSYLLDLDGKQDHAQQALLLAAENGHRAVVSLLWDAVGSCALVDPALCLSARQNQSAMAEDLLKLEPSQQARNCALWQASGQGHADMVCLLLEHRADINAERGQAIQAAIKNGHVAVCRKFADSPETRDFYLSRGLMEAAFPGHLGVIRLIVASGRFRQDDADHAAMFAAQKGHVAITRCLIEARADPTSEYVLLTPVARGYDTIVGMLLEAKADASSNNFEALRAAVHGGRESTMQLLLSRCNSLDALQGAHKTATRTGRPGIASLIWDRMVEVRTHNDSS